MAEHRVDSVRNVALIGPSGVGKTTLTEALLVASGRLANSGSVEKTNTFSDFDPLEKLYQHSLYSSLVNFEHNAIEINLFDTPGFPDFIGETLSVLPAVETVALVLDAGRGLDSYALQLLQTARQRQLCCVLIINKIDAEQADPARVLAQVQLQIGRQCLPLNLPATHGQAVLDCFFDPHGKSDFSDVSHAHEALVDQVIELDAELMERYLEQGQSLDPQQLHAPFEQALREGHLVPVCFVSARSGAGIAELLQVFSQLLPNPSEGNPQPFLRGEGTTAQPFHAHPDPEAHVLAEVFKVISDPFVGKLALLRVHQGTLRKDAALWIGDARKPIRATHLYAVHGKEHTAVDYALPGDIRALAKIDELVRDVVLHDSHDEDHIHLSPLPYPTPLFGLALEPASRGEEQKLTDALQRLQEEDPCLQLEHNSHTREMVLRGLTELHLRVVLERLQTRFRLEVNTRPPRIAYRETITQAADGHYRHKKQSGGAGQFGEVYLRIEPLGRGTGFEFVNAVVGGSIPGNFIPAVEKGVREALAQGVVAGFPLEDLRVIVTDGKHHAVDSKEIAFVIAGREALLDAAAKAQPQLLEPMVNLQVHISADYVGAVSGDLATRRARILGSENGEFGDTRLLCQAPLAELNDYASQLKSLTGASGQYQLSFSHYETAPAEQQQRLANAWRTSRNH